MIFHTVSDRLVSAKIESLQYFCCNRKRIVVNGQKKDCKGKGFARNLPVIRHEERPEEDFRQVRARQLESEEQVHGLVRAWNERRKFEIEEPFYEDVIDFLKSNQDALFFANGQSPDVDVWSDDEEEEDQE